MRSNLPITRTEYPFPRGAALVSTTDLKGRITYCNASFVAVSGFAREELLGQPHNLVRHPDMPAEAFRDLWATIAAGRPWTGVVKNRRKNGDHYWVLANATPLMAQGRVTGYLSVRSEASRAQIEAAEALYARMRREEQAGRLSQSLEGGELRSLHPVARLLRRLRPGVRGEVLAWGVGMGLLGLAAGFGAAAMGGAIGLSLASCGVGIAGLLAAWRLHAIALKPLRGLVGVANALGAGDLAVQATGSAVGEFGQMRQSLNQVAVNMRVIVGDVRGEMLALRGETDALVGGNRELSARTETQAANLEQTAAAMEQITATVMQSTDAANRASDLVHQAAAVAERTGSAVMQASETMQRIRESSRRIGEISQVIDAIAFQTNLLALNAAVEAARAGEQGRGFAVVATEVRALSQRTSGAAREIKGLIEDSAAKVAEGAIVTEQASAAMGESLGLVRNITRLIEDISGGAYEQACGIAEVKRAIDQLDQLTQQNAGMVRQLADSATALQSQAGSVEAALQVVRLSGDEAAPLLDAVALRRRAKAGASMQAEREVGWAHA